MAKDHSARILSLSRDICDLSAELDRLLRIQASRSSPPVPPVPSSVPSSRSAPFVAPAASPSSVPTSYKLFRVGDIVRITNRYGGFRNKLARIIEASSAQTFELKLLDSGETLTKRKWNVDFVRRPLE